MNYGFLRGTPNRITQYATPYSFFNGIKSDLGLFVQDRWTVNRLALNYGAAVRLLQRIRPRPASAGDGVWMDRRAQFREVTGVPSGPT